MFEIGHKKMTITIKTKVSHGHTAAVSNALMARGRSPKYAKWESETIAYLDDSDLKFQKILKILKEDL